MPSLRDLVTKPWKRADEASAEAEHAAKLSNRAAQVATRTRVSPPVAERKTEMRALTRFVPQRAVTTITVKTGKRHSVRIMNMSRNGVAIEADFAQIAVEDITLVGQRAVTYIRNFRGAAVFRFNITLDEKECNPTIIL
jgi:hypothetical protein